MSKDTSTAAGVGTGAAAGALSGAGAGTAVVPGIGTAIGAAIGAIAGGISGGMKAHADAENREEEVKRVQQREDTAQQRAVYDAFMAGVDNRVNGNISPAGSASVAPQEIPETTSDIVSGLGQATDAFKQRFAIDMQAQQMVGDSFGKFLQNADIQYNVSSQQRDKLMTDMATRLGVSTTEIERVYESVRSQEQTSIRNLNERFKSDVYKDLSSKIDIKGGDKFSHYTDQDWDSLYADYKLSLGASADSSSGTDEESTKGMSGDKQRGVGNIPKPYQFKKILTKDEFIKAVSAGFGHNWGDSEGTRHGHDWGYNIKDGENITSTTDHDNITNTLKQTISDIVTGTIWDNGNEHIKNLSSESHKISDDDMKVYKDAMRMYTYRMDFFNHQRSTDYQQYVSKFYPNMRRFISSMQYGDIDTFNSLQFDTMMFNVDRVFSDEHPDYPAYIYKKIHEKGFYGYNAFKPFGNSR